MSTHDDDRDAEMTTDWPGTQPGPEDDGEATTVVPRTPHPGTPPPMSPPPSAAPAPPMAPPQAGTWNPQWQNTPGAGPPPGGGWMPPTGPGQYPPNYLPAPATPPRGRRWGLIAAGLLAVVVIAVAATVFVMRGGDSSTPTATPSLTPTTTAGASSSAPSTTTTALAPVVIDPTQLKGLLASVPEIGQLADNAVMTAVFTIDAPLLGTTVDPFRCGGAVTAANSIVYQGSAYTGFAAQVLSNAASDFKVTQSVASFTSDTAAQEFVDRQFDDWQTCESTNATLNQHRVTQPDGTTTGSETQEATTGSTAVVDGTNSILFFGPSRECQHAMTPRKNVVVDVRICAASVSSTASTLARDIGEKITAQR
ncbi:sensor domain-containing protein [Mycobacterium sp. URHB0044]|uniref:sensor domain-containing protein n=1 Tax=Mycobacterium sp. URHB0044 TaxID=1380386 RepID=UPI00048E1365|nr:sensor domain-containing protein [Mycobacterium sp. URHB0044]